MSDDFDFDDILDDLADEVDAAAASSAAPAVVAPIASTSLSTRSGPPRLDGVEVPDASWVETIRRDTEVMRAAYSRRAAPPSRALRLLGHGLVSPKAEAAAAVGMHLPSAELDAALRAALKAKRVSAAGCDAVMREAAKRGLAARYTELVRGELAARVATDPDFASERTRFPHAADLLKR